MSKNQDKHEVKPTSIEGLFYVRQKMFYDERGSFREAWRADEMEAAGLPQLEPVQLSISDNNQRGILRGIHAEPWDKFITPAAGEIFAAYVDLRDGEGFGRTETFRLKPGEGIFVPKGCGNSFLTLSDHVVYAYLVTDFWKPGITYPTVFAFDPKLKIRWPIEQAEAVMSDKDQQLPHLKDVKAIKV